MAEVRNALSDGRPAHYELGDEVVFFTHGVEGDCKLVVSSVFIDDELDDEYKLSTEDGEALLFSHTADKLKPYAGSNVEWQREGRAMMDVARERLATLEAERDDMNATISQLVALLVGQQARIRRDLDADTDISDHAGETVTLTDFQPNDDTSPFLWVCRTAHDEIFFAETRDLEQSPPTPPAPVPRRRTDLRQLAIGLNIRDNQDLAAFLLNMRDRIMELERAQNDREAGK